jgi:hypothetical protein
MEKLFPKPLNIYVTRLKVKKKDKKIIDNEMKDLKIGES